MKVIRVAAWVAAVLVGWLVFWSVDYEYNRNSQLSAHLRLRERVRAERSAFSLFGHAVPAGALPVPSREDRVVQQRIMRGDSVLWQGIHWDAPVDMVPDMGDIRPYDSVFAIRRPRRMFVSPDERYVAMQSEWNSTPVRIFDVATSNVLAIPVPDTVLKRGDFGYPLRFHAWSSDSRTLYLRTHEGMNYEREPETHWFREIWTVDAASGKTTRVARCVSKETIYEGKGPPDWSATPCSDTSRP